MAADSDGKDNNLTAVVICEGDYHDPTFPQKLNNLVARLNSLVEEQPKSKRLKVNKVSENVKTCNYELITNNYDILSG
jgi:nuclear receptor coactivator 6